MIEILIVANETAAGPHLIDVVLKRRTHDECAFTLLVPATPPKSAAGVVQGGVARAINLDVSGGVLGPLPGISAGEPSGTALAAMRLRAAIDAFRANGVHVTGEVGESDPLQAIDTYLKTHKADEIIVSTLHRTVSRWLHLDLPSKVQRKFNIPVTVVSAES